MSATQLLTVPDLYRGGQRVVQSFTLQLPVGTNVALAGLNGAGKTTLFHYLSGTLVGKSAPQQMGRVTHLAQEVPAADALSVSEFAGLLHGIDLADVDTRFDSIDLSPLARRRMGTLSGGERQLVCALLALATPSELILLDEPTTALDMSRRGQLLEVIRDRRGLSPSTTILVASPVPSVLVETCTSLVTIQAGVVEDQGALLGFLGADSIHSVSDAILAAKFLEVLE